MTLFALRPEDGLGEEDGDADEAKRPDDRAPRDKAEHIGRDIGHTGGDIGPGGNGGQGGGMAREGDDEDCGGEQRQRLDPVGERALQAAEEGGKRRDMVAGGKGDLRAKLEVADDGIGDQRGKLDEDEGGDGGEFGGYVLTSSNCYYPDRTHGLPFDAPPISSRLHRRFLCSLAQREWVKERLVSKILHDLLLRDFLRAFRQRLLRRKRFSNRPLPHRQFQMLR